MPDFSTVLQSVFTMALLMVPGILLVKLKLVDNGFISGLTSLTLYVAQPFLIINAFMRNFDAALLADMAKITVLVLAGYALELAIVMLLFKKSPESKRGVLRFLTYFFNCGFMGLPVLRSLFGEMGETAVLYGTVAIVCHNILTWTIGVRMLGGKGQKGSWKKIINPGTVACLLGLVLLVTSGYNYMPSSVVSAVSMLSGMVTPLAMFVVGALITRIDFKHLFNDGSMWLTIALRLVLLPLAVFGLFKLIGLALPVPGMLLAVPFIQFCMPCASVTPMMARTFGGDDIYASAGVSISTLLSVLTIPLMTLLLSL